MIFQKLALLSVLPINFVLTRVCKQPLEKAQLVVTILPCDGAGSDATSLDRVLVDGHFRCEGLFFFFVLKEEYVLEVAG